MEEIEDFNERQIEKKASLLREKFFLGHQKAQIRHKNGIVFIGNSRVGKSTLSAMLWGIKMRRRLDGNFVIIQPFEQRYRKQKNLVQHTFTSVTQFPNIRQITIDGQNYTGIDLPGFMDSSQEKELCNESYIRQILQKLDKVLFVMVVHVHSDHKTLKSDEISMMKRFKKAFPQQQLGVQKPKENLCLIVNFLDGIETQQKQNQTKKLIRTNIEIQLRKQNLYDFYIKALDPNRLLLIERAKNDFDSTNNQPYVIPKLSPFIKSQLSRMEKTKLSQYKIDLNKNEDRKTLQLRKAIETFVKKTFQKMDIAIELYKRLFSELLGHLTETAGVQFNKDKFRQIQAYHKKQNIQKFEEIQLERRQTVIFRSEQKPEAMTQAIFDIVELFHEMNCSTNFESTPDGLTILKAKSLGMFMLIENFSQHTFDSASFQTFTEITLNITKCISVEIKDLFYLLQNIQDFSIPQSQFKFHQLLHSTLNSTYSDNLVRVGIFKDQLKRYFTHLLKIKQQQPVTKIDVNFLKRLKNACQTVNLKQLRQKTALVIYQTIHKKISNSHLIHNPQLFCETLQNLSKINLKSDELQHIENWKNTDQQWVLIKGKNYLFLLKYLAKTGYKDKKTLFNCYFKLNSDFQQMIQILKQMISQVQEGQFDRLKAYELCLEAQNHMMKHWYISGALKCCKLAEKLFMYQDRKKTLVAQSHYLQILKLVMHQQPQLVNGLIDDYAQSLKLSPWTIIQDQDYQKLLDISLEHVREIIHKSYLQSPCKNEKARLSGRKSIDLGRSVSPLQKHVQSEQQTLHKKQFSNNQQQIISEKQMMSKQVPSQKVLSKEQSKQSLKLNGKQEAPRRIPKFKSFK